MVGKVEPNDAKYLQMLLDNGYTPVIASLAMDDEGKLYNVNADDAALAIARVLKAPLYYISDVPGVLDKNGNLIATYESYKAAARALNGTSSALIRICSITPALHPHKAFLLYPSDAADEEASVDLGGALTITKKNRLTQL